MTPQQLAKEFHHGLDQFDREPDAADLGLAQSLLAKHGTKNIGPILQGALNRIFAESAPVVCLADAATYFDLAANNLAMWENREETIRVHAFRVRVKENLESLPPRKRRALVEAKRSAYPTAPESFIEFLAAKEVIQDGDAPANH